MQAHVQSTRSREIVDKLDHRARHENKEKEGPSKQLVRPVMICSNPSTC